MKKGVLQIIEVKQVTLICSFLTQQHIMLLKVNLSGHFGQVHFTLIVTQDHSH